LDELNRSGQQPDQSNLITKVRPDAALKMMNDSTFGKRCCAYLKMVVLVFFGNVRVPWFQVQPDARMTMLQEGQVKALSLWTIWQDWMESRPPQKWVDILVACNAVDSMMMYLDLQPEFDDKTHIRARILNHVFGLVDQSSEACKYMLGTELMINVREQLVRNCVHGGKSPELDKWELCVADAPFHLLEALQHNPKRERAEVLALFDFKAWTNDLLRAICATSTRVDVQNDETAFKFLVWSPIDWVDMMVAFGDAGYRQWLFDEQFGALETILAALSGRLIKNQKQLLHKEENWKSLFKVIRMIHVSSNNLMNFCMSHTDMIV
jgi:hypothetical protein